jgi:hypothetical protein
VTDALHKFSQVRVHVSDQDVASVAKVMDVNAGQARGLERRKPDAFAEVAVMQ